MIAVHGVTLTYPDGRSRIRAVDDVTMTVHDGSTAAVVGPSGSGKSSLLAVASTLIAPDDGTVRIDDVEVTALPATEKAALRRDRLGIVFQQSNLLPALTAVDQLVVMTRLSGRRHEGEATAHGRAMELLDAVGLADDAGKRPAQLSGGERQRVNIARALMNGPTSLLIDEPTSALDQERGAAVIDLILRLTAEHRTATVLVTHDLRQSARMDAVWTMVDGRLSLTSS